MLDVQAVFIRDVVKLHGIDFVTMMRVDDVDVAGIDGVTVNSSPVKFIVTAAGVLYAALPAGLFFEQVAAIRIHRTAAAGGVDGVELVDLSRATTDSGLLEVLGEDFTKVSSVRVNKNPVDHVVVDHGTLYCTIPPGLKYLDSVDVISTSKTVSRTSFFEYMLGDSVKLTSGSAKMSFQFIKLLMTTQGSDVFNKDIGGNMQHWVGQKISLGNPYALIAKTVVAVTTLGASMAASQLRANLPPEERLVSVQVTDVGFNQAKPDVLNLSIKLTSAAQQAALISLMLGTVDDAPNDTLAVGGQ